MHPWGKLVLGTREDYHMVLPRPVGANLPLRSLVFLPFASGGGAISSTPDKNSQMSQGSISPNSYALRNCQIIQVDPMGTPVLSSPHSAGVEEVSE